MPVLASCAASSRPNYSRPRASSRRAQNGSTASSHLSVPVYEQELWTSGQRQANPLHEISYRACFKPQLPAYFIERLTREGDAVYDP